MKHLAIFDLDGTLLNSIEDLAASTNFALKELGYPTHPTEEYRFFVGNGINKLFERALPESRRNEEEISAVRRIFLEYYNIHNADYTCPYKGIPELLDSLQSHGVKLAVASNKYQAATEKLVKHYFPDIKFSAVLGQRENVATKPDPTIIFEILEKTKCNKPDCIYIGDSNVDMQTGINAGICVCGVSWGFRTVKELESYSPNYIVNTCDELLKTILEDEKM